MKKLIQFFLIGLSFNMIVYSQNEKSPEEIYKETYKSIVLVSSFDKNGSILKFGTGIIISIDGLIYTNFHVISGAGKIEIKLDSLKPVTATVAGFNPMYDAAVLKIEGDTFSPVKINEGYVPAIGEIVYALGNPKGLTNTFSQGIISARRDYKGMNSIQYTASTSHGSSGGALMNSYGEVIGITSAGYDEGQNLNFAIPVSYFKKVSIIDYKDTAKINIAQNILRYYNTDFSVVPGNSTLIHDFSISIIPGKYSYMLISDIYSKAQINDTAAIYLTKSIEMDSTDKMLYKMRGDAYSEYQKTDSAIQDYGKAISLDSNYCDAYLKRAYIYERFKEDFLKAITDLKKVVEIKPDDAYLYINMAEDYLYLKDTINAQQCLKSSSIWYDTDGSLFYKRALIYKTLNLSDETISDLSFALLCSENNEYRFQRAMAYSKAGQYGLAENDYLEILKFDSKNSDAFNNLAYCYMDDNDFDNSDKYFKLSIKHDPAHIDSFLGIAVLYYRQGKIKYTKQYMYSAMKIKRELKFGSSGLKKMEASGYFWNKNDRKDMIKIFRLMGITKTIEQAGKNKVFKHNFLHNGARKA